MEAASKPLRTLVITGGRRRLMSTYPDGTETVEEFDLNTHELLLRRVKAPRRLGEGTWVYEVGEESKRAGDAETVIAPAATNVEWRVRNLPYTSDIFSVSSDPATGKITIRTSNKKYPLPRYYKTFDIPDMTRKGLVLDANSLSWSFEFNTLVVSYRKPREILEEEEAIRTELERIRRSKATPAREGDVECVQQ